MENSKRNEDLIGLYAGLLTAAEVGVGSFMHAFHLPFTGYILSLNQVLLLTKATEDAGACQQKGLTASISSIAAILKSLSPMGKRLTPMIAIAMQGLLFNLGILIGGKGALGKGLGACLLAIWGFLQPVFIYYIIFGQLIFDALFKWLDPEWFWEIFALFVVFKCVLAVVVIKLAHRIPSKWWAKWMPEKRVQQEVKEGWKHSMWKALTDLMMFPFVASIGLTAIFLYAMHHEIDDVVWGLMRPLAVGYLVFFILRVLPLSRLTAWLENNPQMPLSQSMKEALKYIS